MNILIVDMIEGFTREGVLSSPRVAALIPKQVEFLKKIPANSFVVFACDAHEEGDSEFKRMPVHCKKGTKEAEICPELLEVVKSRGLDYEIVPKQTHSAFFGTDLDAIMAAHHASREMSDESTSDDWVVIGCVTDVCITANVMELDYRGKKVILPRDLIDTYEISSAQAEAMGNPACEHNAEAYNWLFFERYLPGVWGAEITTSEQILE
jgi:nicotinamidase-related amidase